MIVNMTTIQDDINKRFKCPIYVLNPDMLSDKFLILNYLRTLTNSTSVLARSASFSHLAASATYFS